MRRAITAALAVALLGAVPTSHGPRGSTAPAPAAIAAADSAAATIALAEQREAQRYWTAERMRRARPADGPRPDDAPVGTTRASAARTVAPVVRATPYTASGPVRTAVGRVFFTLSGVNYSCSGTALSSRNKSTVITAGHCVNAGPGPYARNWVFVPGYRDGVRPYGTWAARSLQAPTAWVRNGRSGDDYGFAVVGRVGGRYLTDVVSGLRLGANRPRGAYVWAFGYPVAAPNLGRRSLYCRGILRADRYGSGAQGLGCSMTAGSSGGPWLVDFSWGRSGTVYSVTSFTYRGMNGIIWGPYLGSTAAAIYTRVQAS